MSSLSVTCWGEERQFVFTPERTALLVIDMQRHFLSEIDDAASEGGNAESDQNDEDDNDGIDMRVIIPSVVRLIEQVRGLGCHVVHTREGYSADLSDVSEFRRELDYIGHDGPLGRTLIRGEVGHDFIDELQPLTGEKVIDKSSFGAFGRTDLDAHLRAAGVTHLIIAGVTTQCCVHSTLREAVDLGYWCLTIADCCAASEPGLHEAALALIAGEGHLFGWVADLADVEAHSETAVS